MRGAIMEGLAGQGGQSGQSQASGGFGHHGYGGGGSLGRMQGFNGMGGRPGAATGQLYNHKNGAQQKKKNRGGQKNKKVSNIFSRCVRINFLMHWKISKNSEDWASHFLN